MPYSFKYPSYIGSRDSDTLDQAFMRIVKAIVNRDAQFLFGAGMSKTSNLPLGIKLSSKLLEEYFPQGGVDPPTPERLKDLASEFPFEAIMGAIENMPGKHREDLSNSLKDIFLDRKYKPSQAHHDFLSICYYGGSPRVPSVLTTNFDTLLEQLIGWDRIKQITDENSKDIRKAHQDGLIPVIHLHGLLDRSYMITEKDIFSANYRAMTNVFQTALHDADAFVFVGYSMSDPDFRRVYMHYREDIEVRKKDDKETYVVFPPEDDFSYRLGSNIWKDREAVWIPLDAENFFARLKHFMETHAELEARKEVKEKYGIKDENVLNDKIDRVANTLGVESYDALQFLLEAQTFSGGNR